MSQLQLMTFIRQPKLEKSKWLLLNYKIVSPTRPNLHSHHRQKGILNYYIQEHPMIKLEGVRYCFRIAEENLSIRWQKSSDFPSIVHYNYICTFWLKEYSANRIGYTYIMYMENYLSNTHTWSDFHRYRHRYVREKLACQCCREEMTFFTESLLFRSYSHHYFTSLPFDVHSK